MVIFYYSLVDLYIAFLLVLFMVPTDFLVGPVGRPQLVVTPTVAPFYLFYVAAGIHSHYTSESLVDSL